MSDLHHAQPTRKPAGTDPDAQREPDGWHLLAFVILLIVFVTIV